MSKDSNSEKGWTLNLEVSNHATYDLHALENVNEINLKIDLAEKQKNMVSKGMVT